MDLATWRLLVTWTRAAWWHVGHSPTRVGPGKTEGEECKIQVQTILSNHFFAVKVQRNGAVADGENGTKRVHLRWEKLQ